ncbi:hypothetical protein [Bdellovibrio sp. BCCA]|uniref:hypothetical protein n=1 Tax=Bdellovibrio sp. BCCA TaxID=3136281 RepID=UPI0030F24088
MKKVLFLSAVLLSMSVAKAEICGKSDERVPSLDPKVGRLVLAGHTTGCTISLVGNKCAITIGECYNYDYAEFNVPASIKGVPQASRAEDIYYVKKDRTVYKRGGIGSQWAVMQLEPNRITQKLPGEVQGYYRVASHRSQTNEPVRVIGYGYALNDTYNIKHEGYKPNAYGEEMHYAQQVSYGKLVKAGIFLVPEILEHNADTSYGSWGAPIISEVTNEIVGISTHGGCEAEYMVKAGARYTNSGTSVTGSKAFKHAIESCLNN